jgi:hypothetical protein
LQGKGIALGFNKLPVARVYLENRPQTGRKPAQNRAAGPATGRRHRPPTRMDAGFQNFFTLFSIFFKKTLKFLKTLPLPDS